MHCYVVGDEGRIRYTANGGQSPFRTLFSGVQENLRKVVIIGATYEKKGYGVGGDNAGQQAVVVGDNGRVLYTNDGGNSWEKLPRTTPEHLISIQFNAFDDFYYARGGSDITSAFRSFDDSEGMTLPFGNGIAMGSTMYEWPVT